MEKEWLQLIVILLLIVFLLLCVFSGYLIYLVNYVNDRIFILEGSMLELINIVVESLPNEKMSSF